MEDQEDQVPQLKRGQAMGTMSSDTWQRQGLTFTKTTGWERDEDLEEEEEEVEDLPEAVEDVLDDFEEDIALLVLKGVSEESIVAHLKGVREDLRREFKKLL